MFNYSIYPDEIANKLIELSQDMDHQDYTETAEQTKNDLIECLYYILARAENEYNPDYFRAFYKALETITEAN